MRACEQGLRPSVRSTLMIGAAGAAVTFGSATAFGDSTDAKPPPSINKYLPYTQIGGTSGDSMSTGGVTLFIPAWQALNQLLFIKVGGDLQSGEGSFSTFGIGYREKIAPTWIIGAFGNYDHTHTKLNDDFNQFVFGAELLNPNWEFHGNAYVADTGHIDLIEDSAKLEVDGNDIAIVREQEAPYSGFDGSGGYRVFKTPGTDGRLYAGGFYFKASDQFDTKPITGPKAGFEFNVYDLDFIGPQSRLQIQGEARHDDVRGNTGFVGINLRVPFNIDSSGPGAQALDELDRRMVDDPQTTGNVLTQAEFNKPEPVIIYGTSGGRTQPTNTIFYIDNSTGRGSYPNPTTFADATTRGGDNALIVITTKEGDVSEQGTLAPGDMVIGAGTTLTIKGSETGYKFTHTFAPGEHDAVLNVAAGQTAITLASNNALYNFAIHGSFGTAIAGNNVGTATIKNITIQGDGSSGQKGIALTQDGASALDLLMTDTSVTGVGSDGISIATHLDGASTLTEKIELSNVSVSGAGGNGVTVSTEASGGAKITQDINFDDVSVAGAGGIGIGIAGFAEGGGSQLTQTGAINNASVSGAGGAGIAVYGYTSGGGALTQTVSIDPTTVNTSGYALVIGADAAGGTLNQTVTVTDFSGSGDTNGVEIYSYGDAGASVYQTAMLSNVSFDAVGHDGVRIFAHSTNGAYVNQGVEFDGLTLNGAGLYDIAVEAYADGGAIRQTAIFNNVTVNGTAQTAIDIYGETGAGGEGFFRPLPSGGENGNYYTLIQNVQFNAATINTQGDGFYAGAKTSNGDSAAQDVSFSSDSSITSYNGGVTVYANASGDSILRQTVHLPHIALTGSIGGEGGEGGIGTPMGGGIRIEAHSYSGSTVNSYTLIDSAAISNAQDFGVAIAAYAEGGNINQAVKLNNATISNYYATGISVYGVADGGATLNQNVFFDNVAVKGSGVPLEASLKGSNGGHAYQYVSFTGESGLYSTDGGVSAYAEGANYGAATQTLMLPYIDVNTGFAYGNGIAVGAYAYGGGAVHQGVAMGNVTASGHVIGLNLDATSGSNGTLVQIVTADNFTATGEGSNGIYVGGDAGVGAHLSQYLTIGMATLTNEGGSGVYATLSAQDGANALQSISLPNADTDSSGTGIGGHVFANSGGTAQQNFGLSDISAQYEVGSGISLYAGGGGTATQHVNVEGINASHDGGDGLSLSGNINGGSVGQYIGVTNGTFNYDTNGIYVGMTGLNGAAHQQVELTGVTSDHNQNDGIYLASDGNSNVAISQNISAADSHFDYDFFGIRANGAATYGSSLYQIVSLASSSASSNFADGVSLYVKATGAHIIYQAVSATSSEVTHNDYDGISIRRIASYSYEGAQKFDGQNDHFDHNLHSGVVLQSYSNDDARSYQYVISANNSFNNNQLAALSEQMADGQMMAGTPVVLRQSLSSTNDMFANSQGWGVVERILGQANYITQDAAISGATVIGGKYGIAIEATSIYSNAVANVSITGTSISGTERRGIEIYAHAWNGNGILENATIADTTITNVTDVGLYVKADGDQGGSVLQNLTLTNMSIANASNDGVFLYAWDSNTDNSSGAALQHIYIDGLSSNANNDGLYALTRTIGSVAAQYVQISNSHFDGNVSHGAYFYTSAEYGGVGLQTVAIANSTASGNGGDGLRFVAQSHLNANMQQYAHITDTAITSNSGDGIYIEGSASNHSFTEQALVLTEASDAANAVSYNGGDGIRVVANALRAGNVEQNISIYNADVSHNGGDGISLSSHAAGYAPAYGGTAYYSHVSQNAAIGNGQITYNAGNGIAINVNAENYTRIDPFVYVVGETIQNNSKNGISETSTAGAFAQLYGHFYVVNSHVDNNTGAGFFEHDYAAGLYSTTILTTALAGTDFDNNGGAGAYFYAGQNYGPGGFGVTLQTITIQNSTFDNNAGSGLEGQMRALGNEGRAEQHFNISGSTFDYNAADGISLQRYAGQGVYVDGYACTKVQSVVGGCAFDRQTLLMFNSDVSLNAGDGIYIGTTLNHYAAAYAQSGRPVYPTVYLSNTRVNANGGDGLHLVNHVDDHSYLYQGVIAVGSHFDSNGGAGILAYNEVSGGSSINQDVLLYGSSASDNQSNGILVQTNASNAGTVINNVAAIASTISYNQSNGVSMQMSSTYSGLVEQQFVGQNSTFNDNVGGDGINLNSHSVGDVALYQIVKSTGDAFGGFGATKKAIVEVANDLPADESSAYLLAQSLSSANDYIGAMYSGGIYQSLSGGQHYVVQSTTIDHANIFGFSPPYTNSRSIDVELSTTYAEAAVNRTISNTQISETGKYQYAINLSTTAHGTAQILEHTTITNTAIGSNAPTFGIIAGINISDSTDGNGFIDQYVTLSKDKVSGAAFGVGIGASANGGTVIQHVAADKLTVDNMAVGLAVSAYAHGAGSITAQYIQISGSHFDNDSAYGAIFISKAVGAGALTGQVISIDKSTSIGKGTLGFAFTEQAYGGAANQYAHLSGIKIDGKTHAGIGVSSTATLQGFGAQTLILTGAQGADSFVSHNATGIIFNGIAETGGNVEQGLGLYYTNISHNTGDGVSIIGNANGSLVGPASSYYSHVAQNVLAYHDSFSNNGKNGVEISNVALGGAQINSFAYFYEDQFNSNKGDGLHVYSKAAAGTNVYDDIYVVGGSASHNGANGIDINSTAYQSTYLIQHIAVIGAVVNSNGGGESGGNGFVDIAHAQGQYSLNGQYITLANSKFDKNNGAGAVLEAAQTYGPGDFGVSRQYLTVVGSDFSHNTHDGLYAITDASGNQGRAEQHFTIDGSKFDNNGGDGIHLKNYVSNGVLTYGTGSDGTYPLTCNYVQGADGGCAFVRQTVDITNSDISHNTGDGIYISTVLNNYAAAYNVGGRPLYTPTLYLNNVTVDHNANGLHITNAIGANSYEYQYIVAVNSHFDHNQGYGILSGSGVGSNSSLYQKIVLASQGGEGGRLSSVDHNGLGGIDIETGATYSGTVLNALTLAYTDVSNNGGNGVAMHMTSTDVSAALQSFASIGSNFANNSGDGVLLYARSAGDGLSAQIGQSYYDNFTKNGGVGIDANAIDNTVLIGDVLHTSAIAAQSITSVGDHFSNNGGGGILQTASFEAPSIAYQKLYVSGDTFAAGGFNDSSPALVRSDFQSGSANGAVYRTILNSSFAGGEGNAIDFYTSATGFAIDRTVISGNTIRNAGQDGVKIVGMATSGGTLYQSITMNGDHVYGSGGDGVYINATGRFGGKVIQDIAIDGLISKGNGGDGLSLTAYSTSGGIAVQYVQLSNSQFLHNGGNGVALLAEATGQFGGIASQQISIANSQLLHNGNNGFYLGAHADNGASIQQYALLSGVDASYNGNNGIRVAAYAQRQGFVAQGFVFDGTANAPSSITHNGSTVYGGGDGVYISARAIYGGEIEQNSQIYNANISHNANDGIKNIAYAKGSYPGVSNPYYSHISQNMAVGYGVIAHNGNDGVEILNTANPGTGINQYLGFYYETISANGNKGIYEHSVAEAYIAPHAPVKTYLYSSLYVIGGSVTKNGGESGGGGVDLRSYADGTTYAIQHVVIQGAHVDGNYGDGLSVIGSARGLYSLNIQYVTLAGSTFDHNTGNGAHVYGHQFYGGTGGFGSARQYVTIQQSDFSHNGQSGLDANALSTDEQGSVVQDFTIANSTVDNNGGDGIHLSRTAGNGTYLDGYPCSGVQGLYGGCAFVRQTVQIAYSDISHNTGDGIFVGTTASNYGAVYSAGSRPKNTPTILLYQTNVNGNGGDGLHLVNNASGGSDIYQYVVAVDSHFNHNAGYGIEAHNNITGGSTLFQNIVLYHYVQPDLAGAGLAPSMTVGNNGKGGVHIATYADTGASVYEGLTIVGTQIGHNTGDGVNVLLNAKGTAKATQGVFVSYSDFVGNTGDGVHISAYGLGGTKLSQTVISENNYFARNGGTGLYVGFKENGVKGASQHVTSYFDDFRQNGSGIGVNTDFIGGTGKLSSSVLVGFDSVHGGKYGIDVSLAASNSAHVSGFQKISYVGVENTKGDGIDLSLSGDTNAKWSNTAQLIGNGVDYAGGNGIAVDFTLNNGAHLGSNSAYQGPGLLIQRNIVKGHNGGERGLTPAAHGHDGIYVGFTVNGGSIYNTGGERGHVPFVAVIDNNTISYVRGDGIRVATATNGGTLDTSASIYGNTVNYAAYGGIVVSHDQTAGRSNVSESIHGNHVYANNFFGGERGGPYGNEAGIEVTVNGTGGTIFDGASIYSNLTQGHDIGIAVETHGGKGTDQFADIYGNQIYRDGTGVYGFAGGTSSQDIVYASNSLSFTGDGYYFNHDPGATQTLN